MPSGKLCFFRRESYSRKEWVDSESKRIEEKIPEIIAYFEIQAQKEIDWIAETKRKERFERRKKRIKVIAIKRMSDFSARKQELKNLELSKLSEFILGFKAWKTANEMREYLAVLKINTSFLSADYEKWVLNKIDWITDRQ